MEGIVIIAAENRKKVHQLRQCFKRRGQRSMPCRTIEKLIEELCIMPTCNEQISFVIVDLKILRDASCDLINELLKYIRNIPFMLL